MNFDFSDEQNLLRDQARRLLRDLSSSQQVRHVLDGEATYNEKLWNTVVEMGWTAVALPEVFGGFGLGYIDLCVIAEELGRALAAIPFSSSVYLSTEAILLAGSDEQKRSYLPRLGDGSDIGTIATLDPPQTGGVASETGVRFEAGFLSGTKLAVADGNIATIAVVCAADDVDGPSLFVVDLREEGVNRSAAKTLDPSRNFANITFDSVPAQRLGSPGQGLDLIAKLHDRAAVLFAFEQLGGAQAALDMAVAYAKERYAFGRPIGGFQAIKHKLADLYCLVELARSNCYYAAWDLARSSASGLVDTAASAAARLSATRAYEQCSRENIHVHGGMGFTWEFDCHLHYRRSKSLAVAIGTERHWRRRLMDGIARSRTNAST